MDGSAQFIFLVLGVSLIVLAPLLRHYRMASPALAIGALVIVVFASVMLARLDPRMGQGALESDRKFSLVFLAWNLPVVILALLSWRWSKWMFWVGWAIGLGFSVWITVVLMWLAFFWHW